MDWEQIHNASAIYQQIEVLSHRLDFNKRLLVRGVIRRERRSRRRRAQFSNNPHSGQRRRQRGFIRVFFLFILLTVSTTTALLTWHIHPRYAAPLLFAYELLILVFILVRLGKRQWIRSV